MSSTKPTRTNYTFKGWGTSASATTVSYNPGGSYTKNAKITLYAIWELSYVKPRITSLSVARCTSDGTKSEEGTYALVVFNWACDKTVSSVKIEWKLSSASSWGNSTTVTASGTSGSVSKTIGANALSTDNTYSIRATVADASGSTYKTVSLGGMAFPIDIYKTGNGIAFGKPAELSSYMDVGYASRFRKNVVLNNNVVIYGKSTDDTNQHLVSINTENNFVLGYGGYSNTIGSTNIYGNTIKLTSKDGIYVEGRKIATNKVLWSGEYYMGESQSCTLSEAISDQAIGIVLVWSEYDMANSTHKNQHFNITFIPRRFVSSHAGKGISAHCATATGSYQAIKYVVINDSTITGYSNNTVEPYEAACGVTMTPKKFVLRYVIGV